MKSVFTTIKLILCQIILKDLLKSVNYNGGLYKIKFQPIVLNANSTSNNDQNLVHRRMGHSSVFPSKGMCEVCIQGKQTRLPFKPVPEHRKAKRILEIISSDVCGPITPTTHNGKKYYVTFIDHFSHFCMCFLICNKSEVLEKFEQYVKIVESKHCNKIERLRCDNGGEYASGAFHNFCKKNGIKVEYTIARNPEQNGVAERFNRTLMNKARCMILDSKLDKDMWGEAVLASVFLINRTASKYDLAEQCITSSTRSAIF